MYPFWEPSAWATTLDKIARLSQLAAVIENFCGTVEEYANVPLETVLLQHPGFRAAILGGVTEMGDYREDSLARVFREQFGLWVDTKQYAAFAPFGEADRRVALEARESPIRTLVTSIRVLCDKAAQAWGDGIPGGGSEERLSPHDLLDKPSEVVACIGKLLQLLTELSVGVDQGTTLAFMTRRITGHHLRASFLEAAPEEAERFLEAKLGFQPLWRPEVGVDDYTIWGYPDHVEQCRLDSFELAARVHQVRSIAERPHSFGATLLALNRLAWLLFHPQEGSAYTLRELAVAFLVEVPDLFGGFRSRADALLRNVPRPSGDGLEERLGRQREIEVRGPVVEFPYVTRSGNRRVDWSGPVHRFLDWLIPAVVYGQYGFEVQGNYWRVFLL